MLWRRNLFLRIIDGFPPSMEMSLDLVKWQCLRLCSHHFTRAPAPPKQRRPFATRSPSAAGTTRGERRTHWTSLTRDDRPLSCLNAGAGERPFPHLAFKAESSGRRKNVSTEDERGCGTKRSGRTLQCERRTQLAGSSARSGSLKTMATAARLRLSSKIGGLGIQGAESSGRRSTFRRRTSEGAARNGQGGRYSASDGRNWLGLAPDQVR